MSLKPKQVAVQFGYECPSCKCEYWFDFEETRIEGINFVCCGAVRYLAKVLKTTVNPVYASTVQPGQSKPVSKQVVKNRQVDVPAKAPPWIHATRFLKKLGYTADQYVLPLKELSENNPKMDKNTLVRETLKRIE